MQTLHKIITLHFERQAIFRVTTKERGDVFMRVEGSNDHDNSVVEVDANKFLSLWQKEPYSHTPELLHGDPEKWKKDYKFHHAESGYLAGENNPVPLAEVGCNTHTNIFPVYRKKLVFFKQLIGYRKEQFNYISFSNGITRSIWLMAYGAEAFPVACRKEEAPLLQRSAGLHGGKPQTIAELLSAH